MQRKIHQNTFKGCTSLTSVQVPKDLLSIDNCAFQDCSSLKSIDIGEQVKFIGTSAFQGDTSLSSVDRFNDVDGSHTFDIVANYAFAGTALKTANLALRSSAIQTFWGEGCFQDCTQLSYVHILSANYLSKDMFKNCSALTAVDFDVGLMAYTYPNIFENCVNLQRITPPVQLLFVPKEAFKNCSSLLRFSFTDGKAAIDEVQQDAFNGCDKLYYIKLPTSIKSISQLDPECFANMPGLLTVDFTGMSKYQLSNEQKYSLPASFKEDIYLNKFIKISEDYYDLYPTWDTYLESHVDDSLAEEYRASTIYDREIFEYETEWLADNYELMNILSAAAEAVNLPITFIMHIKWENGADPIEMPILQQDICDHLFYTEKSFNTFQLGATPVPDLSLNVKIGTKTIKSEYIRDLTLYAAYADESYPSRQDPDYDPEYYKDVYNGLSSRYPKLSTFVETYKYKKQLSSLFIDYTLDIGYLSVDVQSDDLYDDNGDFILTAWNSYLASLSSAIQQKLTILTRTIPTADGTLKNSMFKAINEYFFGSYKNVNAILTSFNNYCIAGSRLGTTKKQKKSVKFPFNPITYEYYTNYICDSLVLSVDNIWDDYNETYIQQHGDTPPEWPGYDYDIYWIEEKAENIVNTSFTSMLSTFAGAKPLSLDLAFKLQPGQTFPEMFEFNNAKHLADVSFIRKYNWKNEVLSSGFFGLKHNVRVACKDTPNHFMNFMFRPERYIPPTRIEYSSDKTTTSNFQLGKWYYNAREIYAEARQKGIPCLFIYSLWGCGPCGIYQKNMWNNPTFQDWFKKQKFLLCGLECEQQPMYDDQLRFLVDTISPNASNFAKEDLGETIESKKPNAMNQIFKRYKQNGDRLASNLMTPVLVFMDNDGACYDYTYHYIADNIRSFGIDGMIQQLKSLCLYHFDNNSLLNPKYTVDAGKAFNPEDYKANVDNPWRFGDTRVLMLGRDVINEEYPEESYYGVQTIEQLKDNMLYILKDTFESFGYNFDDVYISGCLLGAIEWLHLALMADVDYDSPDFHGPDSYNFDELNAAIDKWYIMIDEKYYKMHFNKNTATDKNNEKQINNPCVADSVATLYRVTFSETVYNGE